MTYQDRGQSTARSSRPQGGRSNNAKPVRRQVARGDRVVLLMRDGSRSRQTGTVLETRLVPNPFGGRGEPWARVAWVNGATAWMAIGRSLEVIGQTPSRGPNYDPNRRDDLAYRDPNRR